MRFALALLGLVGCAAAQAVTALISPTSPPPAGCTTSRSTDFMLSIVSAAGGPAQAANAAMFGKRAEQVEARQNSNGQLLLSLSNGVLKDSNGRQGYVASNFQFQFDGPPQAGAIYTAGFSICANNTIALGGNAIWWSCSSGSSFDNLYDRNFQPSKCKPVYFYAEATSQTAGSGTGSTGSAGASTASAASTPSTMATAASTPATNGTTTAAGASTSSAASNATMTTSSSSSSAASTTSGSSSSAASSSGGSASTPSSASKGAAAMLATQVPQALLPWAVGVVGALAIL